MSAAIRRLLDESGVTLHTSSYGTPGHSGWLDITPGDRRISVDRIVTLPRLVGPRLRGIACDRDGLIATGARGRLAGLDGVFAAGDATSFPVKQGGLAAQQADAVAETIAASVGVDIVPQPFRPILRGLLLTGGPPRYLQADISGRAGDDLAVSGEALWWPPDKLAGRYLAPYLSSQVDDRLDVMPGASTRSRSRPRSTPPRRTSSAASASCVTSRPADARTRGQRAQRPLDGHGSMARET